MADRLSNNDSTSLSQNNEFKRFTESLHGPFINPQDILFPALELQLFALEMGCVDKDGFNSNKIKAAIEKYVVTSEKTPPIDKQKDNITQEEVADYINRTTIGTLTQNILDIYTSIPNLKSPDRLSSLTEPNRVRVKENDNSCYYPPFSPISFAIEGFKIAAKNQAIDEVVLSDTLSQVIDDTQLGGIELSIQSVYETANYFDKIFSQLNLPPIDKEKCIQMASHAIFAHEAMHATLDSMSTSKRGEQFGKFLIENASPEELLSIKSRLEVMSWLVEEIGVDGRETIQGSDHEKRRTLGLQIKEKFKHQFGESGVIEGIEAFRELMENRFFDLSRFVGLVNNSDAIVDFTFEPINEKIGNLEDLQDSVEDSKYYPPTQMIKVMGDTMIRQWYLDIWETGPIPEIAKSIVKSLPESISIYAPQYILGEELPSTMERVVYDHFLSGILNDEQNDKLWTGMDENSFLPILNMYPALFELINRNGITFEEYMEMQSTAAEKMRSPYSNFDKKKFPKKVEELYSISMMNPVLLLGYLVRMDPKILNEVR